MVATMTEGFNGLVRAILPDRWNQRRWRVFQTWLGILGNQDASHETPSVAPGRRGFRCPATVILSLRRPIRRWSCVPLDGLSLNDADATRRDVPLIHAKPDFDVLAPDPAKDDLPLERDEGIAAPGVAFAVIA
jgi:hypothetical protein